MGTAQTGRTHGCTDQCCIRSRKSLPTRSRPHMGVKRTSASALPQLSSHHLLCVEYLVCRECRLGIVCHLFQWTTSISKAFQAVRIQTKKLLGSKYSPLNHMDQFVKVDRFITYVVLFYEKSVQIRNPAEVAAFEIGKAGQSPR